MSSKVLSAPSSNVASTDRYKTFRGREPARWLAEFREAGWPDLAATAVTSFLMGARPVPPSWEEEMMPAQSRQADAIASGAAAAISGQIAQLEPRPNNGYLAESRRSAKSILIPIAFALLAVTMIVVVLRSVGTMEYRWSVNHYCMSGPASRCPDYPRTPGKFSYEIDPDAPAS
jgi:hypothetical protein